MRPAFRIAFALCIICQILGADEPDRNIDTPDKTPPTPGKRFSSARLKPLRDRIDTSDTTKLKKMTWNIGEITREALVYVPASPGKTVPLVFVYHGHGGRPEHPVRRLPIHEFWPEAICVYPQGLPTPVPLLDPEGKLPGWQTSIGGQQDRDLLFFDAMLKTMTSDEAIDEERVYVTGHSNGGNFTYLLWAARGDKFAAVAPIATIHAVKDFKLQKPKPVLHIAGEKDPIVKFSFQEWTLKQVRNLNECDREGKPAGEFCTEYRSSNGSPVVAFIHPGGHEIPNGAAARIVEFFKDHPKKSRD